MTCFRYSPTKLLSVENRRSSKGNDNAIQTLDRRTTGATFHLEKRRPFIRSGLVQAETAYRRTNTNVSRSEMPAGPMDEHHNPDPNSKAQRKLALVRAARQYAKQYTWRTRKDPLHSDAEHRRATRNLLRAASSLPGSQRRRTIGTEHGKLKPAISHLLGAAHGYRTMTPTKFGAHIYPIWRTQQQRVDRLFVASMKAHAGVERSIPPWRVRDALSC